MADSFDPYYTWLGIRPEEQPPDHYRLIGLRQFEDNADVIANATDRQMQFLRTMQVGKRSAQSQTLLNEISAAGGCLLDPERKSAYDKELKSREAAKAKIPVAKARPPVKAAPLVAPLPEADPFSLPMPQRAYVAPVQPAPQQQQRKPSYLPLILGGAAGGVVLLLLVVIVSGRLFSGGNGTAAKVNQSQTGTVPKEGEPSTATAIKNSPESSSDKAEKAPGSETVKPVSASADSTKGKDWSYGFGAFDQISNRVNLYSPLKHWTGDAWQVSKERSDKESGWVYVDALGGSPDNKHNAIRRWTAPQSGKLSVTGELKHLHMEKKGDGIRGRLVSSRKGLLSEWQQNSSSAKTDVDGIEVQAGDQIDFVVDCWYEWLNDTFTWVVDLRLTDAQGKELGTWNSAADFHGPLSGQFAATSGSESTKPPVDPNWKPPTADSQTTFRSVLGTYMYSQDRAKTYPFVNLQVPRKNLWTPEIAAKLQGKVPYDEISYVGTAKIAVPSDGTYVWDAEKSGRLQIDGKVVAEWDTPKGEIQIARGVHELIFEIGSHGGNWMRETNLGLKHKETGEEVPFFNTWQDIQKFLATPINGQSVTEVSGWLPTQENEVKMSPQSLAALSPKGPTPAKTADPTWKPRSNMAFRSMLGNYMFFLERSKTHPIVNLSVPNKNLWTDEIQQKVRGRGDFNEISYVGKAKIALPAEGLYVLDTDRVARVFLDGNVISEMDTPKGDIRLPRGVHDFVIEIHSHGQPYVQHSHLSLRSKETGEEVVFFNTWRDVQRHLSSTVKGQRVMEVTGWQPTPENQVANYEQLVARLPVPDAQAEAAARAKVTSVFGDDLKIAKTGAAKQALAKNLLEVAVSTSDHEERYILLTEARRLAAEVKDVVVGSRAIDKLATDFEVDLFDAKVKLLQGLATGTLTPPQRNELLSEVCDAGYEALAAEKPEAVTALAALARSLAGKAVSADTKADAKEFTDLAAAHQKRGEALKKAEQALSASPDDAAANLVVGLQAFFKEGREKEGLAMITKGSDARLAAAAKLRLENLSKGAHSVEEADAWYEAAAAASADFKPEILRTALLAYTEVAVTGGGLVKAKAEKRRDELAAAAPLSADGAERLRRSDVPEKSPGMVGRVLVNGKDSGILITHLTPGEMHRDRLKEILNAAKSRQVRLMLAGTLEVPKRGVFRIFQTGGGNPLQTLLVDGKPLSTIGAEVKGGNGDKEMPVDAGQHVIMWICDYDGRESPRIDLYLDTGNGREAVKTYCTQSQEYDARKRPFHTEIDVAPYGRNAR